MIILDRDRELGRRRALKQHARRIGAKTTSRAYAVQSIDFETISLDHDSFVEACVYSTARGMTPDVPGAAPLRRSFVDYHAPEH